MQKEQQRLKTTLKMIAVEILNMVKIFGIVHVKRQYSSNMIFWILMTCGTTHLDLEIIVMPLRS